MNVNRIGRCMGVKDFLERVHVVILKEFPSVEFKF